MARNTMQKKRVQTVAHGFLVVDGEAIPTSVTLEGKFTEKAAQAVVRKTTPSFSLSTVTYLETLYTMTFDEFYELATPHETKEI